MPRHPSRRELLLGIGAGALAAGAGIGCRPVRTARPPTNRVVVVGAGLSGLVVAHDLVKLGAEVLVLEASSRPGGRIRTVRGFRDGLYVEAGATHVLGDPDLIALIEEMGVEQSKAQRTPRTHVRFTAGQRRLFTPGEAEPDDHPLSPAEQALGDEGLKQRYLSLVDALDPRSFEWLTELAALDRTTGADWLRGMGASPGYIANLGGMFPVGDGIESLSALAIVRELAAIRAEIKGLGAESKGRIAGGTDHLPRAVADRLGDRVVYGSEVRRIERRDDGATLVVADGTGTHRVEAARVVLTMPFSVLRRIEVAPLWSAAKARAIAELGSTSVTRMWLESNTRFWNERGESGTASTDLPIERVRDETESETAPGGVLGVYLSGAPARSFGAMGEKARLAAMADDVEQIHPGLKEHLVGGQSVVWDDEPFARGGYAYFTPGQLTGLAAAAAAPEGVIHFAGDGTSWRPGFMHGAVASAKRVVAEISPYSSRSTAGAAGRRG